jgi:hypothetical protein
VHAASVKLIGYEKRYANKLRLKMIARIKAIANHEGIPIKHMHAESGRSGIDGLISLSKLVSF